MATINGTPGNDLIDELTGGGSLSASDTVNAGSGNDVIQMYQNFIGATDIVHGQGGIDTFKFTIGVLGTLSIAGDPNGGLMGVWDSATGDISYDGIEAFDLTYTVAGTQTLGGGNDIVTDQTNGALNIDTGAGDDLVTSGQGTNTFTMGAGTGDRLVLSDAANIYAVNTTFGGSLAAGYSGQYANAVNQFTSFSGVEHFTLLTGSGGDNLTTGDGNDIVNSGGANDTVTAGKGNDTLDGGTGADMLSIDLSDEAVGVTIDLTLVGAQQSGGTGSVTGFEGFTGTVTGSAFADVLREGANVANATFNTGAGDDAVQVGRGTNTVNLESGTGDRLVLSDAANIYAVNTSAFGGSLAVGYSGQYTNAVDQSTSFSGVEHFTLLTGSGGDNLITGDGNDIVNSGGANDSVTAGKGNDTLDGGSGNDLLSIDLSDEAVGVTINLKIAGAQQTGGTGSITGFEGFTGTVTGSAFADVLREGLVSSNATFNTGAGNDIVELDLGTNIVNMEGGTGDRLVISDAAGIYNVNTGTYTGSLAAGYSSQFTNAVNLNTTFTGVEHLTLFTGSGADNLTTGDGDDIVNSGSANDIVTSGKGNDTLDGGLGNDLLSINLSDEAVGVTIDLMIGGAQQSGGTGSVTGFEGFTGIVTGSAFADVFREGAIISDATFNTGAGNDTVEVARGTNTVNLEGGTGDRLVLSDAANIYSVNSSALAGSLAGGYSGQYTNAVNQNSSFTGVEHFTLLTGSAGDTLTTGDGNDIVNSGGSNDIVTAGKGNDALDGGSGSDLLSINLSDEAAGVTIDLTLIGAQQSGGTGSVTGFEGFTGTVTGSAFADVLREGDIVANATFNSGAGDDIVQVGRGTNTVNLESGTGDRLVISDTANIYNVNTGPLVGSLAAGYSGQFTNSVNQNTSFTGVEHFTLLTGSGNDNLNTGEGNDIVSSGTGTDSINTGGGNDTLDGGAGTDTLNAGAGDDQILHLGQGNGLTTATGGTGADRFFVDTDPVAATGTVDRITDFTFGGAGDILDLSAYASGGTPFLQGYTIGTNAFASGHVQMIAGDGDGDGQADDILVQVDRDGAGAGFGFVTAVVLQNVAIGAANQANVVVSVVVDDYKVGTPGNDSLSGGAGNDTLVGLAGDDLLDGGADTDTASYVGATAAVKVSLAITAAQNTGGAGKDTLVSIENLLGSSFNDTLTGNTGNNVLDGAAGNDKLLGGAGNDTLYGRDGNDTLDGGVGADSMDGGAGNDKYTVNDAGDTVIEAANGGTDTVSASVNYTLGLNVENLTLTGNGAISGTGNSGKNTIKGNSGDNVLTGGAGADTLTGGAGADRFVFDTFETKTQKDTIKDFLHDTDLLLFDDTVFTALTAGPGGALDPLELTFGTKATTADHHLIYNQATGGLFYDADGVGGAAAVQIATLSTKPMLDAGDFMNF